MSDISIQFNSTADELLQFVACFSAEHDLNVVRVTFPPYKAEVISRDSLPIVFSSLSTRQELAFTLCPPSLPAKGNMDFCDKNPDALHLDIGKHDAAGLRESHLSARATNVDAIRVWRKIASRLKQVTKKGAIVRNPKTGHSGPADWQRFTQGAIGLFNSGVPLLTTTGLLLIPTDDVGSQESKADSRGNS